MSALNKKMERSGTAKDKTETKPEKKNYKPRTAGNEAFRLHNSLKFLRTAEKRRIGKSNTD